MTRLSYLIPSCINELHLSKNMIMYLFTLLTVSLVFPSLPEATWASKRLDHHVQHYESLYYDLKDLMYNHHRLRRSNDGPDHINLSFTAFDREFNLRLKPDTKYLHDDLQLTVDGQPHSKGHFKSISYIGRDDNDPKSKVHGHLAYGVFDGAIHTSDEIYYIEPAHRYFNDHESDFHSIIYRNSDVRPLQTSTHPHSPCAMADQSVYHAMMNRKRSISLSKKHNGKLHVHKRQTPDTTKVSCKINVVGDHFFYNHVTTSTASQETRLVQAMSMIRNTVAFASNIFQRVDFNGDGVPDGIEIVIQNINVNATAPPSGIFADEFQSVTSLLQKFSENDWTAYCVSYLFTKRDFENGVLGLAYVADLSSNGGICDQGGFRNGKRQTLNTGIVTTINYNKPLTNAVIMLTFTHELGHNFGSEHDPATGTCSPQDNKYIMTANANDGTKTNNYMFSTCSIQSMRPIVITRGQNSQTGCFRLADDNCGNYVVDDGEDCDCGIDIDTNGICNHDRCCNGTSCRVASGMACSPQTTSSNRLATCCSANCTIIPQSPAHVCINETACSYSGTCNGSSEFCPKPNAKLGLSLPCNNDSNYCRDGECTGTICVLLGLLECECTQSDRLCHVCCRASNGTCVSTILYAKESTSISSLLPNQTGQTLGVGFPCNNYSGYCDFYYQCRSINEQGALVRLSNLIAGSDAVLTAISWVTTYWWAAVIGGVMILIVLFLIVLGCHCILPRPEHMKKRSERRKNIRTRQRALHTEHHQMVSSPMVQNINYRPSY